MEDKIVWEKHEEQIKTLFNDNKDLKKRVESMNDITNVLHNLDKNYALQSQLMKQLIERNNKQDERMDKQDQRMDEYQEIIMKVNTNLTVLAEGQKSLNEGQKSLGNEVKSLKQRVDTNEEKHIIDLRDIEKHKYKEIFLKYIIPASGGVIVALKLLEIWKG